MKYDGKEINISVKEFVCIARRGISPTPSYDGDEPSLSSPSLMRLRALVGGERSEILHSFDDGAYRFRLFSFDDFYSDGTLTVVREIESNPAHPRREEAAQIRGEGYICSYMLSHEENIPSVTVKFVYMSAKTGEFSESVEHVGREKLDAFFKKCLSKVRAFATPEIERVTERLPSMKKAKFPYESIREGQSEMVRTAFRVLSRGGTLYASAPTGTGKTVSALFPAIRALGEGRVEKVFYFTPKTTTAQSASDCIRMMCDNGALIRAVTITAKEKSCVMGLLCRKSRKACKNSRLNSIADAALELYSLGEATLEIEKIREVAEKYSVCPYELSLTYAELCDVVICDINYLFDPTVYIKRFFTDGGRYAFLVDEVHNLPERVREMYSVEISRADIDAPSVCELLGEYSLVKKQSKEAAKVFYDTLYPLVCEEIREGSDGVRTGAVALSTLPERFYSLFDELVSVTEEEIFGNNRADDEERDQRLAFLRDFYYKTKKISDIIARFDDGYKLLVFYRDGEIFSKLLCLDTGSVIRERLRKGHSAVMFSATLSPIGYYRAVLGGDRSDEVLEVSSPFTENQLSVSIMDKISTRFSERDDTLSAVCRVIAATVSAKRGNYMIFSPSFAYSEQLYKIFSAKYPKIRVISQTKNMTVKEKSDFLDEFSHSDGSYLVAFCVMGGIYSEGIDLAGDKLIGAVIVGVGMPQISYEREAIAEYYEEKYEQGKQYAYIYPGINRVLQAAGRVIRREDDRGVIVLIDDRFDDPIYKKSLPALWKGVKFIDDAKRLREVIDEFWREQE